MRSTSAFLALAASLSSLASATHQGFNYGSTKSDGSFMFQKDFEDAFSTAKNLVGTSGFTSARLFTMIQGGSSTNEPIQAIPAAISQKTSLLLGLWASAGDGPFDAEITALKSAIDQYGSAFTDLVVGISVGSEDLYRISPTGIAAKSGYGCEPATLASYIGKLRQAVANTPLSKSPVGHVDTWTAWVNGSNQAVIDSCDFIGMDAYPYFQDTMSNSVQSGKGLFEDALAATQAAVGGREVWITETGWPVSGATANLGVPSTENAKTYWDDVGCPRFGKANIWWYTLQDAAPVTPNPSFGIVGSTLSTTALFDLSCSNTGTSNDTSASPSASTSVPSSVLSSIRSAATGGGVASSGSPLGPSQGGVPGGAAGTGAVGGSGTGSGPAPTGGSSGNYTAPIGGGSGVKTNPGGSNPTATGGSSPGATGGSSPGGAGGSNPSGSGGSSPSSPSGAPVINSNGASVMSASFIGAVGAFFAAIVAL